MIGQGNFRPPPHAILSGLIGQTHRAMVDHPGAEETALFAKHLADLTRQQAKNHAQATPAGGYGPHAGGPAGGPVASALAEPSVSDAEGAAGASALLQALFPQSVGAGHLVAGGGTVGLPRAPASFVPSPVVAALGHGAVY